MPAAVFPALLLGGVAVYAYLRGRDEADDSTREDDDEVTEYEGVTIYDALDDLIDTSLGWPYAWGGGSPSTPWTDGARGVDCSGYVQMCLVLLGILSDTSTRTNSLGLANGSDAVPVGQQRVGDFAYYPGHVMLVAGPPGPDGHSAVIGASGGDSSTHGDDPNARVKLFRNAATYRGDFVCYARIKRAS